MVLILQAAVHAKELFSVDDDTIFEDEELAYPLQKSQRVGQPEGLTC